MSVFECTRVVAGSCSWLVRPHVCMSLFSITINLYCVGKRNLMILAVHKSFVIPKQSLFLGFPVSLEDLGPRRTQFILHGVLRLRLFRP